MASYPSCLVDGRYLVDFCISHPSDYCYIAINKRFWLQYHSQDTILANSTSANTHLLWPTVTSDIFATHHKLLPLQKYFNITHLDTFIHNPFKFASINNRKSRDRICQTKWDFLKSHCHLFYNTILRFDVLTYSVHVNAGTHTSMLAPTLPSIVTLYHLNSPQRHSANFIPHQVR